MQGNNATDDATDAQIETTIGGCWNDEMEELAADIKQCVSGDPDEINLRDSKNKIDVNWVKDDSPFMTMCGALNSENLPAGVSVDFIDIQPYRVCVTLNAPALDYIA